MAIKFLTTIQKQRKPTVEDSSKKTGKKTKENQPTLPQTGEYSGVLPLVGMLLMGSGYFSLRLK